MPMVWHQLFQTDRPSDEALRSLSLTAMPLISRRTYAGWDDGSTLPPRAWYENLRTTLQAPYGWAVINHEDWAMTTQAERRDTAAKFAAVYTEAKKSRPEVKFGFYGFAPRRDLYRARMLPGHVDYKAWQSENDDMAAMAAVVDGFFPSIYYFYNVAVDGASANTGVADYYRENIREAARLRDTYGDRTRPIYPYIWWKAQAHDTDLLDDAAWIPMIEIAFAESDGCVLWGGSQESWSAMSAPWRTFRARLSKRTGAGMCMQMTAAAGWRS